MPKPWLRVTLVLLNACLSLPPGAEAAPPSPVAAEFFEKKVRPLLEQRCFSCHSEQKTKGGLKLTSRASLLEGGDRGPAAVAGKPEDSLLIRAIRYQDKPRMPPKNKLPDAEIDTLTRWVSMGLPWPEALTTKSPQTDSHSPFSDEQRRFWAFQPIRSAPLPPTRNTFWSRSDIDGFILAELEAKGLTPAPRADKVTLIRRATYDLIGLPPTAEEIDAFVADASPGAFGRVVDRLLASPHYGERWGRHWLDVARFGESQGYERDKVRDHAWRYRDYVIQSFNRDKPYFQFVKEQIAGDVLEPFTREGIIATGFLVAGPWDEVGATQQGALMKLRVREEELEDVLSAVGQTFLGLTVNCARCHDHKFDPISQRDYYRLKAVFEGVRPGDRVVATATEQKERAQRLGTANQCAERLQKEIAVLEMLGREKALRQRGSASVAEPMPPSPLARWTFEADARDSIGSLHGTLRGGATIQNGRLRLNGKDAFLESAPLPRPLREKTLEAWVTLATLDQRGGGVMTVETRDGSQFDSIVFAEREPLKWLPGSDFFRRSKDLDAATETAKAEELVHVALAHRTDHSIRLYRNGLPYGSAYIPSGPKAALPTYPAGESRVLFGLRHTGAGNGWFAGEIEEARLYDRALTAREIAASYRIGVERVTLEQLLAGLTQGERQRRDSLVAELNRQRQVIRTLPAFPLVYAANTSQPPPTFLLARGDVEKTREQVSAGGLSVIGTPAPEFGLPADGDEGQRRLRFAEWLVHSDNPLTARILVNRVWHYHFGRGLVGTPNDFGFNGDRPSHPELLDWLARDFMDRGWSIKALHRQILLSSTYQQSSSFNAKAAAVDAGCQLLWRFPPRRLEGEAVRDAMLSVSGNLNQQMGGPSFRPFTVQVFNSHFYTLTDPVNPEYQRRTVYRMSVNSAKSPLLDALDCPDPSVKTPRRNLTTTPLQALGLMNNSFVLRQARGFAERVRHERGEEPASQVEHAYRLALGRKPGAQELQRAEVLVREHGLESFCWVLLNASEFLYVK